MVHKLETLEQLDTFLQQTNGEGLIKVGLSYCAPCKELAPHFEEASEKTDLVFAEVTVDEFTDFKQRYFVKGAPLLLYLKDGETKRRYIGVKTSEEILEWLNGNT